jgi:gamma-glutamyltranspeptidase/glutathione hydrolase
MKPGDAIRPVLADPFASVRRPVLTGLVGAVSTAHPLATAAGQEILLRGGSAVDAAIAAQAVLCVVAPDACGLGGDVFALVRGPDGATAAVNGSGAAPLASSGAASDGGASVTVPGIVDAWDGMAERWARLPLAQLLEPATRIARTGMRVPPRLARAVEAQRARLERGGAGHWALVAAEPGATVAQNELAQILDRIGKERSAAFYAGRLADAIISAVAAGGGALSRADLAAHRTVFAPPISVSWGGRRVLVQPPVSQGVLLAMCLAAFDRLPREALASLDHAGIELTEASFAYRDRVAEGTALLDAPLAVDPARAGRRGGPRAYLHTAGVAVADRFGATVSSLVSVFDDFGSGVFVPEGGFVLNNRGGGFTAAPNDPRPGKRPVHTLAPVLIETERGPLALSTPGADGQIQTLLQVLLAAFVEGVDLAAAVARPRWRSEDGRILLERSHPGLGALAALGHDVVALEDGHMKFGAITGAGRLDGAPVCVADWRRETWGAVV